MQDILSQLINRRVDVRCVGAPGLRGEVMKVEAGVLHLKDDDGQTCYVAIDKISALWDVRKDESRAGFLRHKE